MIKTSILALLCSLLVATLATDTGSSCGGDELVHKYVSVLQRKTYKGKTYQDTANEIIAPNYQDFSDSVFSTLDRPLDGSVLSASRDQFLQNVEMNGKRKPPPFTQFEVIKVLCAEGNIVAFLWRLTAVGSGKYPVKGMQWLYLDHNKQICKAEFEFNSLAWGADTGQVKAYCG